VKSRAARLLRQVIIDDFDPTFEGGVSAHPAEVGTNVQLTID
jgi:hypothetical protein